MRLKRRIAGVLVTALVAWLQLSRAVALEPTVVESDGRIEIRWQGDLVLELKGGRHVRFRSHGLNDHWIGTAAVPADLGWDYLGVKAYEPESHRIEVGEDRFIVRLEGTKPGIDGVVSTTIEANLKTPLTGFEYVIRSELRASQAKWRAVSVRARGIPGDRPLTIEALDFHLNRISRSDMMDHRNPAGDNPLYEGFVVSHAGGPWRFIPSLHTPFPIRKGTYPTIFWTHDGNAGKGYRVAYLDRKEGGWLTEFVDLSSPIRLELCWLAADVHHMMPEGVPASDGSSDEFRVWYGIKFTPMDRREAVDILDAAEPIGWESLPEYELPVFSRYSTFDERLSSHHQYVWCASSYQCAMDDRVGFDDTHSIRITHAVPAEKSAWYAFTWGPHFDTPVLLKGRFRFSAMVRTLDCSGEFRLKVVKFGDADIFLRRTGNWTSTGRYPEVTWFESEKSLTGTTGWTPVHLDVDIDLTRERPFTRHGVVLEYEGSGSIWFDNVRIQQLE